MKNYHCTNNTQTLLSHRIFDTNLPKKLINLTLICKGTRNIHSVTYLKRASLISKKISKTYIFFFSFHKIIKKEYCLTVFAFKLK